MDRREKMLSLVGLCRESGQSQKEFCLSQGITLGKFSYWVAKCKEDTREDGFIPLIKGVISRNIPGLLYVFYKTYSNIIKVLND